MSERPSFAVGLVWDEYTPQVEGQITRDLIALQTQGPQGCDLLVVCGPEANKVLSGLGLRNAAVAAIARLWITYQTKAEEVLAPEHAETVIKRDLFVLQSTIRLDPNECPGYYMKPQGRIIPPSVNINKVMPNHVGTTDPMIVYLWGSKSKS